MTFIFKCLSVIFSLLGLLIAIFISEAQSLELTPEQAVQGPRFRMGTLPFPSHFYKYAPDDLGNHLYFKKLKRNQKKEAGRGFFYTCKAGFLDIAHIRLAADYTAYFQQKIKKAIIAGESSISLQGQEPALYTIYFNYPGDFSSPRMAKDKARLINELSIVAAQRMSYIAWSWHEVITWYGWSSSPISNIEKPSAFSVEDVISHQVGVQLAKAAILHPDLPYDQAFDQALNQALNYLGRLTKQDTEHITKDLKNSLYKGSLMAINKPLKRYTELGLNGEALYGWTAANVEACQGQQAIPLHVPTLENEIGLVYADFMTITIEPKYNKAKKIMKDLDPNLKFFIVKEHFDIIMEKLRQDIIDEHNSAEVLETF